MKSAPLAIWLWYRGGPFRGFQRQPKGPTVQSALEEALASAGVGAHPSPAGRTDRGVHARMQVVSLRTSAPVSPERVQDAIDRAAPGAMGAALVKPAHRSFHAQWTAHGKEYRYRLVLNDALPDAWRPYAWHPAGHPRLAGARPDPERVAALLRRAEGTRDFWAFHEKASPRKPRRLEAAELVKLQAPGLFEARLRGDAFGRYQVRYLVGGAVAVACGALSERDWEEALSSAREIPGLKAPAEGLVLWSVAYPEGLDPFSPEERARAEGLPPGPPFGDPA